MNVVVVGYGMAGSRVASDIVTRRPDAAVTVIGAEAHRAYNRILLCDVVAGRTGEAAIALSERTSRGLDLRTGVSAVAVDTDRRAVSTSDGNLLGYDRLVLATGGRATVPPIKGLIRDDGSMPDRAVAFRTLDDCRRIVALASTGRRAIVLGGGLLGVEVARGLAARGLTVTLLHAVGHLMDRQLDPAASAVLVRTLSGLGIEVRAEMTTTHVRATDLDITADVAEGESVTADLLVVACGVRPDTTLAEAAGLTVERGIVVDDRMRTSDPAVFAVGDCVQHSGVVTGLVAPAWAQAEVAADVISGVRPLARYRSGDPVTRLKAAGIDLAAMGDSARGEAASGTDQVTFSDPANGTYAKLVIRSGRLAGAIMMGDNPMTGEVISMFDRGRPVPVDVRSLLLGRAPTGTTGVESREANPALMPDSTVVCRCNTVTKGAIVAEWHRGARDRAAVADATRATTGCGGCLGAVDGIIASLARTEGVSA